MYFKHNICSNKIIGINKCTIDLFNVRIQDKHIYFVNKINY